MVCWLVLPFVGRVSPIRLCILSSSPVTISWLLLLLPEPRRIRTLLLVSSRLLLLTLRSGVLVTPRYSSELVYWVTWKRFVKTGLVKFCLGFKLKQEERPLDWSSRKCKTKKLALYCLQRTIRNYYIGKT